MESPRPSRRRRDSLRGNVNTHMFVYHATRPMRFAQRHSVHARFGMEADGYELPLPMFVTRIRSSSRKSQTRMVAGTSSPHAPSSIEFSGIVATQGVVPVRGYDKGCSHENVEFVGLVA